MVHETRQRHCGAVGENNPTGPDADQFGGWLPQDLFFWQLVVFGNPRVAEVSLWKQYATDIKFPMCSTSRSQLAWASALHLFDHFYDDLSAFPCHCDQVSKREQSRSSPDLTLISTPRAKNHPALLLVPMSALATMVYCNI